MFIIWKLNHCLAACLYFYVYMLISSGKWHDFKLWKRVSTKWQQICSRSVSSSNIPSKRLFLTNNRKFLNKIWILWKLSSQEKNSKYCFFWANFRVFEKNWNFPQLKKVQFCCGMSIFIWNASWTNLEGGKYHGGSQASCLLFCAKFQKGWIKMCYKSLDSPVGSKGFLSSSKTSIFFSYGL